MAFAEACLLACFLERPLYFLVRGDVFKKGWNWFFEGTNQIPIYRFRDGFSNMRRNRESFARAHEALAEEKAILIFSEGNTRLQKKLSPLQKGLARLAFGAYSEKNVEHIQVVPVGVNYSDGKRFRSDVEIKVGDPILLDNYTDLYDKDAIGAVKEITDDIYDAMLPLVIHIEEKPDEKLADRIFEIYRNASDEYAWPVVDASDTRFNREKEIADKINRLSEKRKDELMDMIRSPYLRSKQVPWKLFLILFAGTPIAFIGFILNAIPFYLSKYIANKNVRQAEFYTPVRMGLNLVLYSLWLLINFILLMIFFGWYSLLAIWIYPLAGFITILWKEGFVSMQKNQIIDRDVFKRVEELLSP